MIKMEYIKFIVFWFVVPKSARDFMGKTWIEGSAWREIESNRKKVYKARKLGGFRI